jgi:hypothetical protein
MRVESIAKKVSCTVVRSSLMHSSAEKLVLKPWEECNYAKPLIPIAAINPPKNVSDMTKVLSGFTASGRLLDYYA